jgi:hypothetical protein
LKQSNELLLKFSPAEKVAKDLEKEHGKVSVSRYVTCVIFALTASSYRFGLDPAMSETLRGCTCERCKLAGDGTGDWN